jgi:L-2-hydroxycarboxylate dehydrogenase (NAD+)
MTERFTYEELFTFTKNIFLKIGSSEAHAELAAKALLSADLRGVDSHGIARLSGYVRLWQAQRVNTNPQIKVVHETPSTAVVDGDKGLGLVVGPAAMQMAIDKAKQVGTGWVSVKNSNHFGIAGFHGMMALQHDMIGIAMTNASATVAPTFAKERLLGTNPICVVIPAGKEQPFVADFATTTAANGKLEVLQRKNNNAPHGWVQDAAGNPSTDVNELKKGGAMLPLGGDYEHGSHKGYMLGAVVDIFSAILSGANYGPWVPPFPAYLPMPENMPGEGIGHFFGAMRIDAFRPADEFKQHMGSWIQRFKSAAVAEGFERVVIPGEPEREMEKQRMENGIELLQPVIDELNQLAAQLAVQSL